MKAGSLSDLLFRLLLLVCTQAGFAVDTEIQFQHYTVAEGLSQNSIQAVSQDSTGYLWFGTVSGLDRFDGNTFKTYRNVVFDSTSLSHDDISSVIHDHAGRCWVGSNYGGLNLLDPETDRFFHFRHEPDNSNSICSDSVTALFEDSGHSIWVGTVSGLDRLDLPEESDRRPAGDWIARVRVTHIPLASDSTGLPVPYITALHEDTRGFLWIGTEGGLFVVNPDSLKFIHYRWKQGSRDCIAWDYIRCIYEDRTGQLWIGIEYGGLNRLIMPGKVAGQNDWQRLKRAKFEYVLHDPNNQNSLASDVVNAVLERPAGILWIGTDNGLDRLNVAEKEFVHFQHHPDKPSSLSNNIVSAIVCDWSGLMWICTDGGLNTFHDKQHQFSRFQSYTDDPKTLSHHNVWCMAEDSSGDIWIGTTSGLNRFTPGSGEMIHYMYDRGNPSSLGDNAILSMLVDRDQMLWVGLNGYGLDRAVIKPGMPMRFIHMDCTENGVGSDFILTLFEDRDGALWIGTWDKGLRKILPGNRKKLAGSTETRIPMIRFCHDPDNPNSISPNRIYTICQDHTGALWIGSDGDGINVLSAEHVRVQDPDREPVQFAHFRTDPRDPNSLSHNIVMCILEDRNHDMWFGTFGGGLNRYNRKENRFDHFSIEDGLPDDVVYGILEDGEGFLWISTNKGLSKFEPQTVDFHNFTPSDGLQNYEFNSGAYLETRDGHMAFGGIDGFNYFHPADIALNNYVPPVVISGFLVNNRPRAVTAAKEIVLSHEENYITVEFAALNMVYPEKNRYRYQLLPLEKDWIESGNQRKAIYTHLAPGHYEFRVQGSNNDGVWNRKGTGLAIWIKPPYWKTSWFRILMVVIMLLSAYIILHFRTLSMHRQNQKLEHRVMERTEALAQANEELQTALESVKRLEGLLPICASCKKIRDENGNWQQVDVYVRDHSDVEFSHGLCPDCYKEYEAQI
ncbi:hypothetical protein JW948_18295 [bacterium]|nr:hypothetical protein [bacterium]